MRKSENKFAFWDIFFLVLASIFIGLVIRVCLYRLVDTKTIQEELIILSLSVSLTIFAFQYKALRKQKVCIAWTILSLVILAMSFWLCSDASLYNSDKNNFEPNNYLNGLKVPSILLIFFWISRKLSNKYFGTELLLPRHISGIEENREYNLMDYVWTTGSVIIILLGHIL